MPCRVLFGCCWYCCTTSQSSCVSITSSCATSSRPAASRCATSSCQPSPATCACLTPSPPTSRWTCCLRSTRAPDLFQSHRICFQLSSGTVCHPSARIWPPSSSHLSRSYAPLVLHLQMQRCCCICICNTRVAHDLLMQYAFVAAPQKLVLPLCVHRQFGSQLVWCCTGLLLTAISGRVTPVGPSWHP